MIKTVILCGGRGTRLGARTEEIPKPLVEIGGKPILWHIMKIYSHYGLNNFVLCLGYKGDMIKTYFQNSSEFNIEFVDTGLETGTAGRLYKVKDYLDKQFCMTYGDGLSDVSIKELLNFHNKNSGIMTVTAIRPLVRFGLLDIEGTQVKRFSKNSVPVHGWIDGGFFVVNKDIFKYLENSDEAEMLEGRILDELSIDSNLFAFKHRGYWKCIDTPRDLENIEEDILMKRDFWRIW